MEMVDKEKNRNPKNVMKVVKKVATLGMKGNGARKNVNLGIDELKKTGKKIKKGFDKKIVDSGIGKKIAKELIDVGVDVLLPSATTALSMALGDPSGLSGAVTGKLLSNQINQATEKRGYGYGVSRNKLKQLKDEMATLFKEVAKSPKHAKALANKVFREGEDVLDMAEVKITGGKISLSKVKKNLISGAKKIWKEAKPILKAVGETALAYGEPLIEEGLKTVAMSYGVDPATADLSSKIFTGSVKESAQEKLNKFSKKSKSPEEALDKVSALVQKRADKYIAEAERRGIEQINRMPVELQEQATEQLLSNTRNARNVLDSNVEAVETQLQQNLSPAVLRRLGGRLLHLKKGLKVNPSDRLIKTFGMGCCDRENMGTLLRDDLKSGDFIPQANIPQGLISGGSFRISGGMMYGGSFRL